MPDIQQIESEYPKYRYSIQQLLELSCTACLPFDLSKFTYDAARAGVIPSLDNCTMASRKSSASYNKAGNIDTASNSDILLFQGNRVVQPGRQPKIPPPVERQKDEGFARFLKKHTSPTHNRVTAGGRIVPMEPRSPPVFALSSNAINQSQSGLESQDIHVAAPDRSHLGTQVFENRQLYEAAGWPSEHAARSFQTTMAQPVVAPSIHPTPIFNPQQPANGLMHVQMCPQYPAESLLMPMRSYLPEQQLGGPVLPHHMQGPQMVCNSYYSPSAGGSAVPVSNELGSSPTWSAFDHNLGSQDPGQNMMPTYQLLVAYEQLYFDLDSQLKHIDRHRAMHQLDPYLADQRKEIVQRRSDAKDAIKECQMLLGLRRMTDTSQDSFATSFNVDAPAYVPSRAFGSVEPQAYTQLGDSSRTFTSTDKPKASTTRRAIPIVSPPKPIIKNNICQPPMTQDNNTKEMDVDEWGVQNRPAPPEIHREQSRLSDMIQAEQRRSASRQDEISQLDRDSQPSVGSHQGVTISRGSNVVDTNGEGAEDHTAAKSDLPASLNELPRDNADEMQRVMDAISKAKGTTTRVRLLDNRVIDVEGQGLSLSAIEQPAQRGRNTGGNAYARGLVPSVSHSKILRDAQTHATNADHVVTGDEQTDKENKLVAPQGHQKAATDAFLAQFNAVEDNVALAARADNRSLHDATNGLIEACKRSDEQLPTPSGFSNPGSIGTKYKDINLPMQQDFSKRCMADQDSMSFQTATFALADDLMNKGYSSVSVQNINAVGRLPQNFDGAVDARQMAQAHLAATEKAKSPRLFKRQSANGGGAWYGPFSRDMFERARTQTNTSRTPKKYAS